MTRFVFGPKEIDNWEASLFIKEAGLLDILYIYSVKGELLSSRIDMLQNNGSCFFLFQAKQVVSPSDGCIFQFDLRDPFADTVLD